VSDKTEKTEKTEAAEVEVETVEVPQDLSALTAAELSTIQNKLTARGRQLAARIADGAELSSEEVEEANLLGELDEEISDELSTRDAKKAELAGNLERFADKPFKGAAKPFESDEDEDDDEEEEMAVEADAELASDDTEETEETEAVAEATEATEGELNTQPRRTFKGADMSELASKSPAQKPKNIPADISVPKYEFSMESTRQSPDGSGQVFETPAQVAQAMWKKRMSFGNIPSGTREEISIATGTKVWDDNVPSVGLDPVENLKAFNQLTARDGLVASGAQCTPQTQLYDFFRLAEPIQDVENAIPTVQAPRGGIRYIQANCDIQGAGAVGLWGSEAGGPPPALDPDTDEKPCATVTCPSVAEVLVEAVTQCTIFDNLQYRTFPELIENFLEDVAVQFTLKKQTYYLDAIDTASTQTVGIGSYGAARSMVYDLTVAAVAYRKRHHMPRNARLSVLMPDWAVDVVKADLFNDGSQGLDYLNVPDSALVQAFASRNLDVTFYYDDPTSVAGDNPLTTAQAGSGAELNDYPCVASSYLYAPGTFVKLDGGSLDVGLVRDHALNKTNDFAMFMEEWIGIAQLGCESVRIDSTVVPSGARAPYAAALRECVGS
jgi:hypothetical protein